MSANPEDETLNQLVIVRRRGRGDHEGHHGGAWKIAYADFMTAMMAFFLVMWLVGMTDEKTIVQVAAYFNPLRLTDKSPTHRGLSDAVKDEREGTGPGSGTAAGKEPGRAASQPKSSASKSQRKSEKSSPVENESKSEADLFADPLQTLDRLSKVVESGSIWVGGGKMTWGDPRSPTGSAASSPYDPLQWVASSRGIPTESATLSNTVAQSGPRSEPHSGTNAGHPAPAVPAPPPVSERTIASGAERQATAISTEIERALAASDGPRPQITVKATSEGVLISLSDDVDFGMFSVGSAEPVPAAILAMDRIGTVLRSQPGQIVVGGHTDGRPYRSTTYDNWRLSTARAHMAQYMLVRAGVAEDRIERVQGHADRKLLNSSNREAAQNRRIEILLKDNSS